MGKPLGRWPPADALTAGDSLEFRWPCCAVLPWPRRAAQQASAVDQRSGGALRPQLQSAAELAAENCGWQTPMMMRGLSAHPHTCARTRAHTRALHTHRAHTHTFRTWHTCRGARAAFAGKPILTSSHVRMSLIWSKAAPSCADATCAEGAFSAKTGRWQRAGDRRRGGVSPPFIAGRRVG